jgi:hypothetical protein
MRRTLGWTLCLSIVAGLAGQAAQAGNCAPKGAHEYQLNIIGTTEKNPDMTGNNGHRIFVPLYGTTKIMLSKGDFAVTDANGTDGEAGFQLPDPDLDAYVYDPDTGEILAPEDPDVESAYSVFIRPLGKPGGSATMTTCAELMDTEEFGKLLQKLLPGKIVKSLGSGPYCSIEQVGGVLDSRLFRDKGKSKFENVTAELLTIVLELEILDEGGNVIDTVYLRIPLFDDALENYYWEYDNNGLRVAQVRFYDCATNVHTGATTCDITCD